MEKKAFSSSLLYPLLVVAIAVIGLAVGSFQDLAISSELYRGDSTLYKLASYCTPLIGLFVISSSSILLFLYYRHSKNKKKRNASFLALLIAPLGGIFYGVGALASSFSTTTAMILGILVSCLLAVIVYFLLRKRDPHDFGRIGYIYLLSSAFVFIFVFFLRLAIVRPSYNMLILTDEIGTDYMSFFKPWYLFNTDASAFPETVSSSYYASFPSISHALASLGLVLPVGCPLFKKIEKEGPLTFVICLVFVLLDGIMNILLGKAFLSDLSFALLIASLPLFFNYGFAKEDKEAIEAFATNKAKHDKMLMKHFRSPSVYGVGARRAYEEQIAPIARKKIRFKNNRSKSIKDNEGPFLKIN